jgi:hypothetical protein
VGQRITSRQRLKALSAAKLTQAPRAAGPVPAEVVVERHNLCPVLERHGGKVGVVDMVGRDARVCEQRSHQTEMSRRGLDDKGALLEPN